MDDDIKQFGYETIKLPSYQAIRLYGQIAVDTELHSEILNLVGDPFTAEHISTFRGTKWSLDGTDAPKSRITAM